MISPMTSSTTLRVLEYGALNVAMPRSAAASRSTWFVPMQKHPMLHQVLRGVEDAGRDPGVGPDAEQVHAGQRLDELVLGQGTGPAARPRSRCVSSDLDGDRVDVLEQQHLHVDKGRHQDGTGAASALGVRWAERRAWGNRWPVDPLEMRLRPQPPSAVRS